MGVLLKWQNSLCISNQMTGCDKSKLRLANVSTLFEYFALESFFELVVLYCVHLFWSTSPLGGMVHSPGWQGLLQWLVCVHVLHVCMNSTGVCIMKFPSQAKQVQLHRASVQTFIIEQQAFIIHTSGFPCTQQINFFWACLFIRHSTRWCWHTDAYEYLDLLIYGGTKLVC